MIGTRMIRGLGIDIVDIRVFRKRAEQDGMLEQFLTPREVAYVTSQRDRLAHAALLFSAKEAVFKGLGLGLAEGWQWHNIEVTEHWEIRLSGKLKDLAEQNSVNQIRISISMTQNHALALVFVEG